NGYGKKSTTNGERASGCVCASLSLVEQPTPIRPSSSPAASSTQDHWFSVSVVSWPTPGNQDLVFQLEELRAKELICWCAPEACHADWLLLLANADMADWPPTPPKEREPEWHRGTEASKAGTHSHRDEALGSSV